jgi:hypothetical protein
MQSSRAKELLPKVQAHLLDCWVSQKPVSLRSVAAAVGELRSRSTDDGTVNSEWTSTALKSYWKRMAGQGLLIPAIGDATIADAKLGFHARGVNLTGLPLAQCSFRIMLEPFLADAEVSKNDKRVLKEGLRLVLPGLTNVSLAGTKTDEMVLVAASRISPELVPKLPALLRAQNAKGSEYGRVFRNCMRHAMSNGHAVAIFPSPPPDDTWSAWVADHLPIADSGATRKQVVQARAAVRALRVQLEEIALDNKDAALPATPDDVTADTATKAITRLLTVHGQHRLMPLYRRILVKLGERGLGPYRHGAQIGRDLLTQADGLRWSPRLYLHSESAANNACTWTALIETLCEHKISPDMIAFVGWIRDFSTLSDRELARHLDKNGQKVFPSRRRGFLVGLGAEQGRIRAFRAYLGAALNIKGIDPAACRPQIVFGQDFELLTDEILEYWQKCVDANRERVALGIPPLGKAKHAASGGIHSVVVLGGMVALMGYERSRHERGQRGAKLRVGGHGKEIGLDWNDMRRVDKTIGEELFAGAYEHSRMKGNQLEADRGGATATTHKVKKIVFEDTLTADLMPAALEALRRRIDAKKVDRSLAGDAVAHLAAGIISSGATRIEELAHLRYDRHFTAAHRAEMGIPLEAWDRKGDYCAHQIPLNEALTPPWLISYVADVARPILLARWMARGNSAHNFVIMDARGRPFGDPLESADGKTRDARVIAHRKGKLIMLFKDVRIGALSAAGLPILDGYALSGTHGDRGRIANIAVNLKGVGSERAARLLGHKEKGNGQRTLTVERSYSQSNLEANRETLHEILLARPWYAARFGPAPIASSGYASFDAERDKILGDARDLRVPGETVGQLLLEAMARWTGASAARERQATAAAR